VIAVRRALDVRSSTSAWATPRRRATSRSTWTRRTNLTRSWTRGP